MVAPTASASLNTTTGKVTPTAAIGDGHAISGQYTGTVLQLPTVQGLLVNPGTTSQVVIPAGKYTLSDTIVQGDANLVAENIKKGVSIFGVTGTIEEGITPSGMVTLNTTINDQVFNVTNYAKAKVSMRNASVTVVREIDSSTGDVLFHASCPESGWIGSSGVLYTMTCNSIGSADSDTIITPTTSNKLIAYDEDCAIGNIYVKGDSNLVAANIKKGVSIFGVAGTLDGIDSTQWDTWVLNEDLSNMGFQGEYDRYYTCPIILFDGRVASVLNAYSYDGSTTEQQLYFYFDKTTFIQVYSAEDYSGTWTDQRYRTIKVPAFIKTYPNESQYTGGGYGSMYAFLQEYATLST